MILVVPDSTSGTLFSLICLSSQRVNVLSPSSGLCGFRESLPRDPVSQDLFEIAPAFRPQRFRYVFQLLSATSRKEVFQPHLPVRLPCYDLAPITRFTLGRSSRARTSGTTDFHGLTGGVYKARERIHRAMADARLLANPTSRSRVADSDPN